MWSIMTSVPAWIIVSEHTLAAHASGLTTIRQDGGDMLS